MNQVSSKLTKAMPGGGSAASGRPNADPGLDGCRQDRGLFFMTLNAGPVAKNRYPLYRAPGTFELPAR